LRCKHCYEIQIIHTNILGAEGKLTDAHGVLFERMVAGNTGFPMLGFALLAVSVERFCDVHRPRSDNGFLAKPISARSAVS